jgi:hypothetical protein
MAPYRLTRPKLRTRVAQLRGFRWALIRRTPDVLIDYLLEVLLAIAAAIVSAAFFTGYSASNSLLRLLPDTVAFGYATALGLAAVTMTYGLARKQYGTWVAIGLNLMSVASVVYSVALYVELGPRAALTAIMMSVVLAGLGLWRSFLLRSTFAVEREELAARLRKR